MFSSFVNKRCISTLYYSYEINAHTSCNEQKFEMYVCCREQLTSHYYHGKSCECVVYLLKRTLLDNTAFPYIQCLRKIQPFHVVTWCVASINMQEKPELTSTQIALQIYMFCNFNLEKLAPHTQLKLKFFLYTQITPHAATNRMNLPLFLTQIIRHRCGCLC